MEYIKSYNMSPNSKNTVFGTEPYIPPDISIEQPSIVTRGIIDQHDERRWISNTKSYPNSAIAYIYTTFPDGTREHGTAFLVNEHQAITAGHCIYDDAYGGFAKSIMIYPGRNRQNEPFGHTYASYMYVGGTAHNTNADWGVLNLANSLGVKTGYFGVTYTTNNLTQAYLTLRGYPAEYNRELFSHSGSILKDSNWRLQYPIDTTAGQSGSPIYDSSYNALGVHTTYAGNRNVGTKIRERMFVLIGGKLPGGSAFVDGSEFTDGQDPFDDGQPDFDDGTPDFGDGS